MAYRRKASMSKDDMKISTPSPTSPNNDLAARATRASAAHRDSSAYAYAYASPTTPTPDPLSLRKDYYKDEEKAKGSFSNSDTKYGFWGVLARKAKSILDDEDQHQSSSFSSPAADVTTHNRSPHQVRQSEDTTENPTLRKRLDAITSSLGTAFEEGRSIMEHKTADIIQETRNKTADFIQETRKLQLRRRGPPSPTPPDQATVVQNTSWQRPVPQPVNAIQETQLKASRDVAMATAAKAKLLLRELKTVKADLAFAKERCAQLEEENKRLRVSREKGDNPADDDLIRLQLETLLTEKARLAHDNSIYARENRFLREIVEYHQLTMQDVVYLDESAEEVTEVSPFSIDDSKVLFGTPTSQYSPMYPSVLPEVTSLNLLPEIKEHTREAQYEVINISLSLSSPSSPHTVSPTSYPPEQTESSIVQTSSQLVADEETEAFLPTETISQTPRKSSISSS